jgi:predicted alpha/beta-hydrolase family hydrolase
MQSAQVHRIQVDETQSVSALLQAPPDARACYVLAHGAGAGMAHPFLAAVASGLEERGVATLRYQFPYMERGARRTDPPALAHATVRAAVDAAARLTPGLPLFAGGKSFGGRMTSQAQATAPLAGVVGLVFLGFPLHPAGKPTSQRGEHLQQVHCPMLFLQGTRDELADATRVGALVEGLGPRATLHWIAEADHAFHVPARSGRKDAEVLCGVLDTVAQWTSRVR